MKEQIGVTKEIDKLGRIVIPKDMRELFRLGSSVEVVITEMGILIRNPKYKLVEKTENEEK